MVRPTTIVRHWVALVPLLPLFGLDLQDTCHISGSIGPKSSSLTTANVIIVSDSLDIPAMLERFRERAKAVKSRPMPPVEGPERKRIIDRAQVDFMDYAIIGDAEGTLEDGVLVLRIDLRPAK
jgi:hypothetical protein